MDLKKPYDALRDLFPQVDTRIIRATVFEHGEDLVSAIEFIVDEVLGSHGGKSSDSINEDLKSPAYLGTRDEGSDIVRFLGPDNLVWRADGSPPPSSTISAAAMKLSSHVDSLLNGSCDQEAITPVQVAQCLTGSASHDNSVDLKALTSPDPCLKENNALCEDPLEMRSHRDNFMEAIPRSEELKMIQSESSLPGSSLQYMEEQNWNLDLQGLQGGAPVGDQSSAAQEAEGEDCREIPEHDSRFLLGCIGDDIMTTNQSLSEFGDRSCDLKNSGISSDVFNSESSTDLGQKATNLSGSITCAVNSETLDDYVQQLKIEKQQLNDVIEEIRSLHQNVEILEASAKKSKQEAAGGGQAILAKVDEMKHMLAKAREANAVHAGEVYGEKAVLATEARELLARLEQIRVEKMAAIDTLNNIREALHARIEAAKQQQKVAEEELLLKEATARSALVEEEEAMAKLSQESRNLEIEEELCRKFREFLIDRGSMVDSLQAEMALLCEDVEAFNLQVLSGGPADSFQVGLESSSCTHQNWIATPVSFSPFNLRDGHSLMDVSEQAQKMLKESSVIYDHRKSEDSRSYHSMLDLTNSAESLGFPAGSSQYGHVDSPSPVLGRFPPKDTTLHHAHKEMEMETYGIWNNKAEFPARYDTFELEENETRSFRENSPEEDGWNLVFRS